MKRVHIIYSGRVQGVAFRFTAVDLAKEFGVVGWVKNLAGGGVELVAEGPENNLRQFLSSIEKRMSGFIKDKEATWSESKDEFTNFDIRY
jgi:acylphosphatase